MGADHHLKICDGWGLPAQHVGEDQWRHDCSVALHDESRSGRGKLAPGDLLIRDGS